MRSLIAMLAVSLVTIEVATVTQADDGKWQSLFDGQTLNGWVQLNGTATYEVINETIVGTTVGGSWNSFLCTENEYADFELEFEVRVHNKLNSGVQIRSKRRDKTIGKGPNFAKGRVIGPQVEIESSKSKGGEAGYIYDEGTGNGWITEKTRLKPHKRFKDGHWNHFRIRAVGPRIETWINEIAVEDLCSQQAYREYPSGFIGLQVHRVKSGAGPFSVAWRNIRIREIESKGFRFQHHFVDRELPGSSWGQTALVDIDRDGDLDFITGKTHGDIRWYEFKKHDNSWTVHLLGRESPSDVGGLALDVDRDGRLDFVTGGAWYRQPVDAKTEPWPKHVFDEEETKIHDIIAADVDDDGHDEVITLSDKSNLRIYSIPENEPTLKWEMDEIWQGVHAGLSAGDIDGDGDIDLVRSQVWLENQGAGKDWTEHKFCGISWANRKEHYFYYLASRSWIADINSDGRLDIVLTENEIPGGRVAWFEAPEDPRQPNWEPHFLPPSDAEERGPYHSLQLADFDNDGDLDVFAGEMESLAEPPHRWFIWQNTLGDGSVFVEHVILDKQLGTHETKAGDVDGDGDIDLVGKLWRPVPENGNRGNNHVDFLENRLIE